MQLTDEVAPYVCREAPTKYYVESFAAAHERKRDRIPAVSRAPPRQLESADQWRAERFVGGRRSFLRRREVAAAVTAPEARATSSKKTIDFWIPEKDRDFPAGDISVHG